MGTRAEKARVRRKARRRGKHIALAVCFFSVLIGGALGTMTYALREVPPLRLSAFTDLSAASLVYAGDRQHTLLGRFASEGDRRLLKNLREAGPLAPKAFLAAEDKDFYHHKGIDPLAILRSSWDNLRHHTIVSGASTITQQTVKLAMFPRQERTLRRKFYEMVLSLELERVQTKSQILLEYLNALYFGNMHGVHVYGIESAALHTFGKHARDLTPAQAAILAAIPNNPTYYSIWRHPKRVLARSHNILRKMREQGHLSAAAYKKALNTPVLRQLDHSPIWIAPYESKNPYIIAEIRRTAPGIIAKAQHISELQAREELETGGYRIYTSIALNLQGRVEHVLGSARTFPPPISYTYNDGQGSHALSNVEEQSGFVILENATSRILALGGGRNFAESQVDHASMHRQPGSSLKPLLVYGTALDLNLVTPGTIIDDIPHHYRDPHATSGDWFPLNWDKRFHGLMTIRDALMQSYNGPAIEVIRRVGTRTAANTAWHLGLSGILSDDADSLGLAIGGISGGVSPLELAAAYATLPNHGIYTPYSLIDRIEDSLGRTIYNRSDTHTRVFTPTTAYLATQMMQYVVKSPFGTAYYLHNYFSHADVAGKTGTTDDNKDAWFVGFTPTFTASAWVGYDIPFPLLSSGAYRESTRPARLFGAILGEVITARHERFPIPANVHMHLICTKSGALAGPLCKAVHETEEDAFADGTAPTTVCTVHRLVATTRYGGKRVLATELTPAKAIKEEILIERPEVRLDPKDQPYAPLDADEAIPHEADPRIELTPLF